MESVGSAASVDSSLLGASVSSDVAASSLVEPLSPLALPLSQVPGLRSLPWLRFLP